MSGPTLILPILLLWFVSNAQQPELIWSDEFSADTLDPGKWSYETGTGVNGNWGTGQLDRATAQPENVSFTDSLPETDNGCLVITTRKEHYIDRDFTSGRILSRNKASWGPGHRISARIWPRDVRFQGQGFAFWMMPDEIPDGWAWIMWPQGGEIDIMEYVGSIPYNNLGTVHYAWFWLNNEYHDWNHAIQGYYYNYESQQIPVPAEPGYGNWPPPQEAEFAGSSSFHIYGIDWYFDRIEFFVDDKVYHIHYLEDGGAYDVDGEDQKQIQVINDRRVGVSEYSNHYDEWHPFEHRMFAILSAGVGGSQYTYGGPIVDEAEFPCSVFIDWVRVYKLPETVGVKEYNERGALYFYPNPASQQIHFANSDNTPMDVIITDSSGNIVLCKEDHIGAGLDVSHLIPGNYFILISTPGLTLTRKLVVIE